MSNSTFLVSRWKCCTIKCHFQALGNVLMSSSDLIYILHSTGLPWTIHWLITSATLLTFAPGMVGLAPKWVRLAPNYGTNPGLFKIYRAKCTEIWSEKVPDLSHLAPIWPSLEPNLPSLLHPVIALPLMPVKVSVKRQTKEQQELNNNNLTKQQGEKYRAPTKFCLCLKVRLRKIIHTEEVRHFHWTIN